MQGASLNRVEEFKYLGSTVQANGGSEKEVSRRIQARWAAWRKTAGIMCDRGVPARVKGKLYKTCVRPAMVYGMETVAVTKKQEKRMEVAEMKMLRFSIGKTRLDRIRNEKVRKELGVAEMRRILREARLRWFGHVSRRDEEYVGQRVRRMDIGTRGRGRPKRRWLDCIKEDLLAVGAVEEDAQDRGKWKRLIRTGDPSNGNKA